MHSHSSSDNFLAGEKSPYLLQHKSNPVHWYPWGDAAFAAARDQDKPIFLSVGYATCHWCHVMERESFEDQEVADFLNTHFISIKVDREEHPDVDRIYMNAVQAMGQPGGWPMSVVMTPSLLPFFGGTYYPKHQFINVLSQLAQTWQRDRSRVHQVSQELLRHLKSASSLPKGNPRLNDTLLSKAFHDAAADFDPSFGGFGPPPKFPPSMLLRLLLRIHRRTGEPRALQMVETTLEKMARGGIFDHLGGGFARYATDRTWLVPHFEKMLYDNALLSVVYLEAFQVTGKAFYASVARDTLDYILRDMTSPEGGFYSAEDADSEGHEGRFYVWRYDELQRLLSAEEFSSLVSVYGPRPRGNFEHGTNILHLQPGFDWSSKENPLLKSAHAKLLEVREARVHPLKDDKQLTSWNGLMITAMAKAYQVLGDERYLKAAQAAAGFIRGRLYLEGRLLRRHREGDARYDGTLEDYAYLVQGLLTLYQTDFDMGWLDWAIALQTQQDTDFWDSEAGGYFYTEADAAYLIVRTRDLMDHAIPNPNAISAQNLLELFHLTQNTAYRTRAETIFDVGGGLLKKYPRAVSQLLCALDFYLDRTKELAIIGDPTHPETRTMVAQLQRRFLPNRVLAVASPDQTHRPPLLKGKTGASAAPTVYVCEAFVCQQPTTALETALTAALDSRSFDLR